MLSTIILIILCVLAIAWLYFILRYGEKLQSIPDNYNTSESTEHFDCSCTDVGLYETIEHLIDVIRDNNGDVSVTNITTDEENNNLPLLSVTFPGYSKTFTTDKLISDYVENACVKHNNTTTK